MKCLCVEDDHSIRERLVSILYNATLNDKSAFDEVLQAGNVEDANTLIIEHAADLDLLVLDLKIPGPKLDVEFPGYDVLIKWERECVGKPIYVVTAYDEQKKILRDVAGYPVFAKGTEINLFSSAVERFVKLKEREIQAERSRGIVKVDEITSHIYRSVESFIAKSDLPVLIIGETGVGKEDLAYEIHRLSGREGPFCTINCAAFPETLILSELFGSVKGAYTDAKEHRLGILLEASGAKIGKSKTGKEEIVDLLIQAGLQWVYHEIQNENARKRLTNDLEKMGRAVEKIMQSNPSQSYLYWLRMNVGKYEIKSEGEKGEEFVVIENLSGGTLFLDEVADLHPNAQAGLLRVLEGKGLRPLGYAGPPIKTNVRIVAATNQIDQLSGKEFRRDLFWRLAGWGIRLPNLSSRLSDARAAIELRAADKRFHRGQAFEVPGPVVDYICEKIGKGHFSDTNVLLESGNFRQLNWLIDRACAIASHDGPHRNSLELEDVKKAEKWMIVIKKSGESKGSSENQSGVFSPTQEASRFRTIEELSKEPFGWIDEAVATTYSELIDKEIVVKIKGETDQVKKRLERFIRDDKISYKIIEHYYRYRYCQAETMPEWVGHLIFLRFWQKREGATFDDMFNQLELHNTQGGKLKQNSIHNYMDKMREKANKLKSQIEQFVGPEACNNLFREIVEKKEKGMD